MPPGSTQYTLVGFSTELDWKPTRFVKPFPPNRICSACGLVPKTTAFLPCMHVVCESCYMQCTQADVPACPLDGYECQGEDVEWRELSVEELLTRQVMCWNDGSGCQYVGGVSGMAQHFHQECVHHYVCCPKCCVTVPRRGVIEHLKSGFCHSEKPVTSQDERQSAYNDNTELATVLRGAFETHAGEIKEFLRRIVSDVSANNDRLNEISHAVNTMKETRRVDVANEFERLREILTQVKCEIDASNEQFKEVLVTRIDTLNLSASLNTFQETIMKEFSHLARQGQDGLLKITTTMKALKASADEHSQKALDLMKDVQLNPKLGIAVCVFFVPNVKSLRTEAAEEGLADYDSERVYLRGYHILPGVRFRRNDKYVGLHLTLEVHKGDLDDFVKWPFKQEIKLSIMHPKGGSKECLLNTDEDPRPRFYARPTCENTGVVFTEKSINAQDLIDGGYVEYDRLRVRLELLL